MDAIIASILSFVVTRLCVFFLFCRDAILRVFLCIRREVSRLYTFYSDARYRVSTFFQTRGIASLHFFKREVSRLYIFSNARYRVSTFYSDARYRVSTFYSDLRLISSRKQHPLIRRIASKNTFAGLFFCIQWNATNRGFG